MAKPTVHFVQCLSPSGLHQMAYQEWGDPDNPRVLLCVHGVTRLSDDFDVLAAALCDRFRVVCPDIVGRGRSTRLRNPADYHLGQYMADCVTLVARLGVESVSWLGTSMGGLIGICIAALPDSPVKRLVINDVGPTLDPAALTRIGDYIGQDMRFASFDEAAAYIKAISLSFGPHSDDEWTKLAKDVLRQDSSGQWTRHYDLGIAVPFKAATPELTRQGEAQLWQAYDAIRCPTLLLRGIESDLLSAATALQMAQRGPRAQCVELSGVGHAPTLVHADQIDVVTRFLLG